MCVSVCASEGSCEDIYAKENLSVIFDSTGKDMSSQFHQHQVVILTSVSKNRPKIKLLKVITLGIINHGPNLFLGKLKEGNTYNIYPHMTTTTTKISVCENMIKKIRKNVMRSLQCNRNQNMYGLALVEFLVIH